MDRGGIFAFSPPEPPSKCLSYHLSPKATTILPRRPKILLRTTKKPPPSSPMPFTRSTTATIGCTVSHHESSPSPPLAIIPAPPFPLPSCPLSHAIDHHSNNSGHLLSIFPNCSLPFLAIEMPTAITYLKPSSHAAVHCHCYSSPLHPTATFHHHGHHPIP